MGSTEELQLLRSANKDLEWLSKHYSEVLEEFDNNFIALKDEKIIASSKTLEDLIKELKNKKIDQLKVAIHYITTSPTIL